MDHNYFNHILCSQHNMPITRIIKEKQINSSKRTLCYQCPGQGASIFEIYSILDSMRACFLPIHQVYKNVRDNLLTLKSEIQKIINQVHSFIEGAINQSEFEITQIEKYVYYQNNYQEFKIEDLEKISDFIYNNDKQENPLNKSTKIVQQIQQSYQNQLIAHFNRIIQLIQGKNSSIGKMNQKPPISSKRPHLVQKSTIFQRKKFGFEKKNEYETSVVGSAIFNKKGDILFQGQYPFGLQKNLEIKQIDNNFEVKNQSIQEISGDNVNLYVTSLAINELTTQLFVGYQNGDISTYQYTGEIWNKQANFRAHTHQVNFLIVNVSNTELFSAGQEDIIKGYCFSEGLGPSNKKIDSFKNISDVQINQESNYLFVIANNDLNIFSNSKDRFALFQQISLLNQKITCISQVNKQIYIGSNNGTIYIYEQKNGCQFDQIFNNSLLQKSCLSMKYCEEFKLLIVQLDDQVNIYQIGQNNQFDRTQEITGQFSLICIQSSMKSSQIILYCSDDYKASHYIMQRN